MKNILLFILAVFTLNTTAQNSELLNKRWFIENLHVGSIDINIPLNHHDFPFLYLDFYDTSSGLIGSSNHPMKDNCNSGFVAHVSYTGTDNSGLTTFNFIDLTPHENNLNCVSSQDINMLNFISDYKAFFTNSSGQSFSYHILDVYGIEHLKIENNLGDYIWFTENPFNWIPDEMIEPEWTLSKINIDDTDIFVPDLSNEFFFNITLNFKHYYYENIATHLLPVNQTFQTSACNGVGSMSNFNSATSQFYLYDYVATLSACSGTDQNIFGNQYMSFFLDNLPGPFDYIITQENGEELLTITNSLGNKAIYGSAVASTTTELISTIDVYPNPASTLLNISSTEEIKSVKIYSLLGQKLIVTSSQNIDIKTLEKGLYIIQVTFKNERKISRQFIKS